MEETRTSSSRADKIAELVLLVEEMERRGLKADLDPELLAAVQEYRDEQAKDDAVHEMADAIAAGSQSDTSSFLAKLEEHERKNGPVPVIGYGSKVEFVNVHLVSQVMRASWTGTTPQKKLMTEEDPSVAAGALLAEVKPKTPLEGMLLAQMVACHEAAMECFRRAMIPEQHHEGRDMNLTQANKLTRSYSTLLQALDKHRGKGQQKVTVEHVHVHKGGQAIVGNVSNAPAPSPSAEPTAMLGRLDEEPISFELAAETVSVGGEWGVAEKNAG